MRQYLAEAIRRNVLLPLNTGKRGATDLDMLAAHVSGSLLGLVMWWLDHHLSPSAEEVGDLFWRLISPGVNDVLDVAV
ncbi:hypothetical protein EPA93_13735 [Ktedonosporobacter rubrisoli]|uniref:Transcriptional regulator TetR C-terminal Firmicutes type domain-containing protein n=1 Tax=Ktedonosporobacter rubrisoli TaxID=2509675 RepID=A0A4P6JNU7_KTERU|nr:TetR-like C-terminal domain-containing protein [Ktedonosporobacter rubrisoli]QBD77007.1 hypothetical protein EPA93_13735 [Ktedonosporobacter rubrisoli]